MYFCVELFQFLSFFFRCVFRKTSGKSETFCPVGMSRRPAELDSTHPLRVEDALTYLDKVKAPFFLHAQAFCTKLDPLNDFFKRRASYHFRE